jgi:hypothetical protein
MPVRHVLPSVLALLVVLPVLAQQPPTRARQFPPGSLTRFDQLPASRLRTQIGRLSPAAQDRANGWLKSFHFTEGDLPALHADADGGIYYVCEIATELAAATSELPAIGEAAVPISPFPSGLVLHSRPGSANVLYLNFSGETVTNTQWNTSLGRTVITALPFSTDTDYSTFSDAEQAAIRRIWQRVAEDYAPFDIDVTTARPATFNIRTIDALITRNTDANGDPNPSSSAGGVAYVNVFNTSTYPTYRPAWIYANNLAYGESYIAEAASHECGHNLGLSHDGTDSVSYYGGHGSGDTSWGPIMGTGYDRNVSQWCKGEYYLANNTEDDLSIISGKTNYRTDDHGGTVATATALVITGGTSIVSTTPETDPANTNNANKGVLERNTDVDVFSFFTGSGAVGFSVQPWIMASGITRGGNLDVLLELRDADGVLLAADNSSSLTTASIQTNLTRGAYYLHVRNTGTGDPLSASPSGYTAYGSLGQYFISGFMAPTAEVVLYAAAMDTDPGWVLEPEWEYGPPGYASGSGPTNGYTGGNIIGYNLDGNYSNNLPFKYAATPPVNCSGNTSVTLHFRRWLGLRGSDTATIEASTNGLDWVMVWSSNALIADASWQDLRYTLPSGMAGSPSVRVRWGLTSNYTQNRIGWNLDDVEFLGDRVPDPIPGDNPVMLSLTASPAVWGHVSPTNGNYLSGSSVQLLAIPEPYFRFSAWMGDVTGTNNPFTVVIGTNLAVQAVFQEILTTNVPTPCWWLAANGYTNDFEAAVRAIGANGYPLWQSYVAGLDPNSPSSQLRLSGAPRQGGQGFVLGWNTATGRVYSVGLSSNLLFGFTPVPGATNLPWTVRSFTNVLDSASPVRFYQIEVRKP